MFNNGSNEKGDLIMSIFNFSKKSHERLITADPRLVEIALEAIKISKVDFGIPEFGGKRTNQEQAALYNKIGRAHV